MKNSTKNILRWIAVLPASFISGFLSTFPLHWILYATLSNKESFSNGLGLLEPIEHFLSPIVLMMVFILVGYKIAPKYKFQTSLVIAILWVIVVLSIAVLKPDIPYLEIRTFFTFISILVALYISWINSRKEKNNL